MSTFLHVISFPFWFFASIFIIGAATNKLTLHFGGMKRKATPWERVGFALVGIIILLVALFLVTR